MLANLEQMRLAAAITPDDVVASWMPYFHDMGLIGTHLGPLAARAKQVRLEPLSFAKRPALWLETAARHRGDPPVRRQLRPGPGRTADPG
ncbi:hypothetical protein GCM10009574_030110 [Streptomyces asiaticus]|uniref:AMP-dependent synthetase/ligase domain-containing protein n=2 Tax=Streptomyces rhizosphaericus TaxID=114699 RepID=A0ABN1PA94_9ACTN